MSGRVRRVAENKYAAEVGAAIPRTRQPLQEQGVVRGVVAVRSGEARRLHSGRALEGRDAQPRVVCEHRASCRGGDMAGLGECVLDEGLRVFGPWPYAEFVLRPQGEAVVGEQRHQFGVLAAIAACENDLRHCFQSSFWNSMG